ncbi:hypothetical protein [uncultured Desulfobacter sp.]|uniref:hypothetical protein n=1 Tax=uncultured Desulfobacter sp. TaxID=240139 RepID=UPI00374A308F
MTFMGIFSGFGVGFANKGYAVSATLVCGMFLGSGLWWLALASVTATAGRHLNYRFTAKINIVTGTVLSLFGIWALGSGLYCIG